MNVSLVSWTQWPEHICILAAKTCYSSKKPEEIWEQMHGRRFDLNENDKEYLAKRIEEGHLSVVEHASFTFAISGISRACTHQLVRHRLASYCIDGNAKTELTEKSRNVRRRNIKELYEMKGTPYGRSRLKLVKLNCMDEDEGKITQGKIIDVLYVGKKECFEIETESGYRIRATKDHLFYTVNGWMRLEDILNREIKVAVNGIEVKRDWLMKEYLIKNRTQRDIAKELGMSENWVKKMVKKFNLKKPRSQYPNRQGGYGKKGMFDKKTIKSLSEQKKGKNNPNWKGGVSIRGQKLRKIYITPSLRKRVYERDNYTCRFCGTRGGDLTLHHVIPVWADEGRIGDMDNLLTLCERCHCKINGRELEYTDQLIDLDDIKQTRVYDDYSDRYFEKYKRKYVFFQKIVKSEKIGFIDTYDIVMNDPHHNFIANGFVVHNSQQSQRYVKMEGDDWYVVPPSLKDDPTFKESLHQSMEIYTELMKKVPKEDARFTLPNATKTNIIVTMNARELLHFFRLRTCKKAQWEIRRLANRMLKEAKKNAPTLFANAGPPCVTEETCPEEDWDCFERMKKTRNNQKRMNRSTSPDSSA